MEQKNYDVLIIGGGISGSALFYELARYTDIKRIAILEKYDRVAPLNSHARANSQTIHDGSIETNYTVQKATVVKAAADMVINYAKAQPNTEHLIRRYQKMVLGVGEKEVAYLKQRYETFKPLFPSMEVFDKERLAKIEPAVALIDGKFRKEEIVATGMTDYVSGADYAALSESFVANAQSVADKTCDVHLNTPIDSIHKTDDGYRVATRNGDFHGKFVVVCAGAHSLMYAHKMGHGLDFSILPVAGSFYYIPKMLKGKVYTVQQEKLPFAAIHGDPDLLVDDKTRLGPTALVLPALERYNLKTVPDFFKTLRLDAAVVKVLMDLMGEKVIRNYILKNFLFEVPFLRERLFLKDAQKIIPALKLSDLSFAHKIGGVRPQMIDKVNKKLLMGEAKIVPGGGIIFNMTPSPGGTSCLDNAAKDMRMVCEYLGAKIDEDAFNRELMVPVV